MHACTQNICSSNALEIINIDLNLQNYRMILIYNNTQIIIVKNRWTSLGDKLDLQSDKQNASSHIPL